MADEHAETASPEQDDVSFLRTDDVVCLSCTQSTGTGVTERVCLAAEGFGNRYCFLETVSDKNYPPDLASCMLVIEQALSVRALQEMVNASTTGEATSQSGHRTLLYGHAVLLRHVNSQMYLTCLSTSSSTDKLAFDVGLRETAHGEACWWTIHPASKQRSEGEKVRVGDDLILVSVATERYLHTLKSTESSVIASFHQTLWTVLPVASGSVKAKSTSFVFSEEIVRFFHGSDECLTIPETWADHPQHNFVVYEGGDALSRARSLWRCELAKTRWAGAFLNWHQAFRILHITTGMYLGVKEGGSVSLIGRDKATMEETVFFLKATKDDKEFGLNEKEKEEEGMGPQAVKYGDTMFLVQHAQSGLWLSYQTNEVTKRGVGKVEEKIAVMLEEGHMDDTLTFSRSQQEESRSARVIRKCTFLFNKFNSGLDTLLRQPSDRRISLSHAPILPKFNLKEMVDLLKDLIGYFAQPFDGTDHEVKQLHLRALRNRQDLFQQEGVLTLVLDTIDKISGLANSGFLNSLPSGDGDSRLWEVISNDLYLLIAAMIKGNHGNCAQFAQSARLDWLFSRLTQQGSEGVLDVLHSVLTDSPEALNMIREDHIRGIISLLDRSGRDHKILDILGSFCVGNNLAVRSSQNTICEHLLPGKDLLLQTKLVDHVSSMHPNIYVGFTEGSAMFKKWYFEAIIDHVEGVSDTMPHIRVGWANTDGYAPYPGGGERWGANGLGDCMFSFGFDGTNIWTGGQARAVRMYDTTSGFHKGDIVGCNLDLTLPEISFSLNGIRLRATIRNFNTSGMFYPVVSMSARSSCRFMLGGDNGRLKHGPPSGFSAVIESLPPNEILRIEPCFYFGEIQRSLLAGPSLVQADVTFVPVPIDTGGVVLPNSVMQIRDKLAENIHELWSVIKIESGWSYGETRDDVKKFHPCLTSFKNLPITEKNYDITLSMETLKTFLALGYHITMQHIDNLRIRPMKLSSTYTQPNGYKPAPLDLTNIDLSGKMEELVEILAENIHTVWAKNRIEQGWTYGLTQQNITKRSPHLVPYEAVEDPVKKMNRDTATEVVRTLIAYGYNLEPPSGDAGHKGGKQLGGARGGRGGRGDSDIKQSATRSFRAEKTYAVTEGKWYYELDVMTPGYMKVGWALQSCPPGVEIGTDENSYAFDGSLGRKWHEGAEPFGKMWQAGDVVGCLLDLNDGTISFTINGELLLDPSGHEAAFEGVTAEKGGFVPACTLGSGEKARFNFGQDIHSLKFFTSCGLQEGYEPFCVNMTRPVPFWYDRDESVFVPVTDNNSMMEVTRNPGSTSTPAGLKLTRKSQGLPDRLQMEYLRLSLPITCRSTYISDNEKQKLQNEIELARRSHRFSISAGPSQPGKIEERMITGGFTANDIQNLTSQNRFLRDDSVEVVEGEGAEGGEGGEGGEQGPLGSSRFLPVSGAPRASLGGDRLIKQRGIMKKAQSLEVADGADDGSAVNGVSFLQPVSNKRLPRSASEDRFNTNRMHDSRDPSLLVNTDCCTFLHHSQQDEKTKKRSQSPFSYIAKKIKDTTGKHRSQSKERLDKIQKTKQNRNENDTQTGRQTGRQPGNSGNSGGPSQTLRAPQTQQLSISNDMLNGVAENDLLSPRVAFGFDSDQFGGRSSSADSRAVDEADVGKASLFEMFSEFHYAVRIFPGQDPKFVYVGWVTSDFHRAESPFSLDQIRCAEMKVLDVGGQLKDHCYFQNAYLVCAGELQEQASNQTGQEKGRGSAAPGIVVGTTVDVATGLMTFTFGGQEIEERHQIEPGTKLFPAVFVEPTSRDVLQFEFSGTRTALPLSSALFHRDRTLTPQCPPRLRVLTLRPYHWSRVPSQALRVHELKMSDVRGWSMLCDDPVSILAVHIPEEDRCIDILELIENEDFLQFHAHTLMLYCAISSHGNHRVAHALVKHVDQKQLLFAIQNPYMSGELRQAFYGLLIALHLDTHAKAMFNTRDEFVIPVKKRPHAGKHKGGRGLLQKQASSLNPAMCTSIRPSLNMKDKMSSEGEELVPIKNLTAPSFPLSILKAYVFDALADGVRKGTAHSRDPIGWSYENLFVPLLKIVDQLLLIGFVDHEDLNRLLNMIDPTSFGGGAEDGSNGRGLLHIRLDEGVKLQLCFVLQDLCDERVRRRIEEVVCFSEEYVGLVQADQLHRYIEIKQSDLPSSVAARKTKEFRCPPKEQMKMLLTFKNPEDEEVFPSPTPDEIRGALTDYHGALVSRLGPQPEDKVTRFNRSLGFSNEELTKVIKQSVIKWAAEANIESQELIREMFSLLHRQYDGVGEMLHAMQKAYVISTANILDVTNMFASLVRIRNLLSVQMGPDEEEVLRTSLWELMNNKVFFQHPDLIGMLCIHKDVMAVMMNTIGKSQNEGNQQDGQKDTTAEMVVACCKFLCYFCRTSRANQKAMFEHLGYLLDNSSMLLYRPSLRGSAPLDVAYFSLMDNSELALSLRESHLEKIAVYLSRCGLQSNAELTGKGYPDIGWDPVEGERYLDFLRFCVWVNGENVEENSNLVVRLLIRKPECLGPALRGEGAGLLRAMQDAILLSESLAGNVDPLLKENEDYVDMGEAILNFYSVLVDLLGRCSPDAEQLVHARSDSVRARAILQSLVPLPDLEGVLSMKFFIPNFSLLETLPVGDVPDAPPAILPNHKQAILVFLERVYGVQDPELFFRLLEDTFLPDLRAATMMDGGMASESDVSLALNRYLCNSVLPLLTRQSAFFSNATQYNSLLEATLHTTYTLAKVKNLTKNQREVISEFLLALIKEIEPAMMEGLLKKLIVDVSALSEHTIVALKLLTLHYDRCSKYYGSSGGFGNYGTSSEVEKRLTMMLFSRIFDSLAGRSYDPELFNYALPCLSAIGSALPPDYALVKTEDDDVEPKKTSSEVMRLGYNPQPLEISTLFLNPDLQNVVLKFAEHYHDTWALKQYESGWGYHPTFSEEEKVHPRMEAFSYLPEQVKEDYRLPTEQSIKTILGWGWALEKGEEDTRGGRAQMIKRRPSRALQELPHGYVPRPVELNNLTLNREMLALAEKLAENAHDTWAANLKAELARSPERGVQSQLVPFEQMTDREKKAYRDRAQDLLKFLLYSGYRFKKERSSGGGRNQGGRGGATSSASEVESRFAYSLLEKLLHYCQVTAAKMRLNHPSNNFTRRKSYKETSGDVKFFGKVVLPLVEQYFRSQKNYFLSSVASSVDAHGTASPKEKEMVANLFCRLAMLLRLKVMSFGQDTKLAVECLQVLVQAIDCSSLIKHSLDFVRTSFLTFFNQAAHDLTNTVNQLKSQNFPAARGTTPKQSTSLGYVEGVLLRVLTSLFDHIGTNNFGKEILINEIQIASYSILDSLYTLGTKNSLSANRKLFEEITIANRPLLGACLAAFASTFPVAFLEPEFNSNNPFCILGRAQEQSLEAQDVMNRLSASLPTMEILVQQIETFTVAGDYQTSPHIVDVVLPMLCSYLSTWYHTGPENTHPDDTVVTKVTSDHLNTILTHVFTLILNNLGNAKATWMERIAAIAGQIIINSRTTLLDDLVLPISSKLRENIKTAHASEEVLRFGQRLGEDLSSVEAEVGEQYALLVRDLYAFYPLAIRYAEIHKLQWIKDNNSQAEALYAEVSEVFNRWMRSQHFKREELNFLSAHDVDVNALISAGSRGICRVLIQSGPAQNSKAEAKKRKRERKEKGGDGAQQQSLIVVCLKRLLPVGLNLFTGREQELVQKVKEKMLKNESIDAIEDFVKAELTLPDQPDLSDKKAWQRYLYVKIGKKKLISGDELADNTEESASAVVERILAMSKVLHGLHLVDHPPTNTDGTWKKLVSTQRKRAIIACFRMVSLHSLPRHRVINLFLRSYRELWLSTENVGQELLVVNLTDVPEEPVKALAAPPGESGDVSEILPTDQLTQIVTALSRAATAEQHNDQFVHLYLQYAEIMCMSCGGAEEEEEEEGGEGEEEAGPSMQEQEEERQKLLSFQNRLADRNVSEMVLMYISASNGEPSETVWATLSLGISILRGGNEGVQKRMAVYLKEKRDVGFFTSMSGLMNSCSVLDLDAFERILKAEGLGVNSEPSPTETNNENAANTCKLFRFLQLLCEGHNEEFQNYLRTQQGNTSTVNLIICTVDYLLRVQESVMDFYWHYSSKEFVDGAGIGEFVRAIKIAAQVFNTLTESIQGPCSENQLCLAHSRLWDAVGGFLFLFANMQDKLAKAREPSQLDLLQEFLDLQNEMMTMLISMLEGNTLNGPIGKQMVDSLAESSQNLEMIIKFFDLFLKLDELVNSPTFKEFDPTGSGWITTQDLKKAMDAQKIYDAEQVAYLLSCISDQDGNIDYIEFTERYHTPAKNIGFNLSLLLTNLNEHTTKDIRLLQIMETAQSMQEYFKNYLGRIEIIGSAKRIERVYFEIPASNREQWEQKQIKESKAAFLHAVVNEGGEKGKLEVFVSFCEDAIFEMQHAASISVKESPRLLKAKPPSLDLIKSDTVWTSVKKGVSKVKNAVGGVVSLLTPGNVKRKYFRLKRMTKPQLALATAKAVLWMFYYIIYFQIYFVKATGLTLLYMMTGYSFEPDKPAKNDAANHTVKSADMNPRSIYGLNLKADEVATPTTAIPVSAFGIAIAADVSSRETEEMDTRSVLELAVAPIPHAGPPPEPPEPARTGPILTIKEPSESLGGSQQAPGVAHQSGGVSQQSGGVAYPSGGVAHPPALGDLPAGTKLPLAVDEDYHDVVNEIGEERADEGVTVGPGWKAWFEGKYTSAINKAAREFYSLQDWGLYIAILINVVLLFYQVTDEAGGDLFAKNGGDDSDDLANIASPVENAGNDEEREEVIHLQSTFAYLPLLIRGLAILHTVVAVIRLLAYYRLKVPLAIFKHEKDIARQLEFDGMYIEKEYDSYWMQWCMIVISSKSFPVNYWDKFVKKKVIKKYKETHDIAGLQRLLGEEEGGGEEIFSANFLNFWYILPFRWLTGLDWRYPVWKWGAIFCDKAFLYNLFYTLFSMAGQYNYFFFALHLLDIVTSSKSLTTILQSVTHNGKQLLLTVMMMIILVWLYTVVAFNFFRKFYVQEEDGEQDPKCHNMLTCFVFHLYNGVRNGGGIGDAINEPDGDEYEYYRIVFDITFFFFIIVILLAIVQGLIIDAFGELRGQLEQVEIDMSSQCFICGQSKEDLDKQPRGFEIHTLEEHNLANYLFFLMHLINKDQTEYTGQETYVWNMYQRRCWDFFPVGESFRIHNSEELFG